MKDCLDWQKVQDYLNELVPKRHEVMVEMESYAKKSGFPIIGSVTGYFCYQIARMMGARNIFELGSGYGYSTAWFARAVMENGGGKVHHVVWDEYLSQEARKHISKLGYGNIVEFHVGEAVHTLKNSPGPFDLIFNDIDKEGYPDSLGVIKKKLRPGGVLIVDNMLMGGHIFDKNDRDPSTEGIRNFTKMIVNDDDWIVSLIPIRDGVIVAYKNPKIK